MIPNTPAIPGHLDPPMALLADDAGYLPVRMAQAVSHYPAVTEASFTADMEGLRDGAATRGDIGR